MAYVTRLGTHCQYHRGRQSDHLGSFRSNLHGAHLISLQPSALANLLFGWALTLTRFTRYENMKFETASTEVKQCPRCHAFELILDERSHRDNDVEWCRVCGFVRDDREGDLPLPHYSIHTGWKESRLIT